MDFRQLIIVAGLILPLSGQAAMYKWVDDQGNTVYSQVPPPDGRSTREVAPPPPPAEPEASQRQLNELRQRLNDAVEDRELQAESQAEQATERQQRRENCEAARYNLQGLQQSARQLVRSGDGDYRRLTPEEIKTKTEQYQKIIDQDCR